MTRISGASNCFGGYSFGNVTIEDADVEEEVECCEQKSDDLETKINDEVSSFVYVNPLQNLQAIIPNIYENPPPGLAFVIEITNYLFCSNGLVSTGACFEQSSTTENEVLGSTKNVVHITQDIIVNLHENPSPALALVLDIRDYFSGGSFLDGVKYYGSVNFTKIRNLVMGYNDINEIIEGVYLGMQPLHSLFISNIQKIKDLKINHLLTLLREYELDSYLAATMKKDLPDVTRTIIPAADFEPLRYRHFKKGVETIHYCQTTKKIVLAQCKAGVGRSAGIVVGYIMIKNNWSYRKTYKFVMKRHQQINMRPAQADAIIDHVTHYKKENPQGLKVAEIYN